MSFEDQFGLPAEESAAAPVLDSLLADLLSQWDQEDSGQELHAASLEESSPVAEASPLEEAVSAEEPAPAEEEVPAEEAAPPVRAAALELPEPPAAELDTPQEPASDDEFEEPFPLAEILAVLSAGQQVSSEDMFEPAATPEPPPVVSSEPLPVPAVSVAVAQTADERRLSKHEALLDLIRVMYERIEERKQAGAQGTDTRAGFVVFRLGDEQYGVPIQNVLETDRLPRMTPLPYVPDFVRGVANRRGEILPMIDLRMLTGAPAVAADGRMLVVRTREGEAPSGLVVDALGGIAWVERDTVSAAPREAAGAMGAWLQAKVEHRERELGIVDLQRLFASKELAGLRHT